MPWLTVLGLGSWSPGRDLPTFLPGSYEVDDTIADQARTSGIRNLLVTSTKPRTVRRSPSVPLTMEDLRGSDGGIALAQDELPVEGGEDESLLLDFRCGMCEESFPSAGARERHIEFHHAGAFLPAESVPFDAAGAKILPVLHEGVGGDEQGRVRGKDWMNRDGRL